MPSTTHSWVHGSFVTRGAKKYVQLAPPWLLFHVSLKGYFSWNSRVTFSVSPPANFLVSGSKNCKVHLGRIVNLLATGLGGSGGGHDKACGAVVPKQKIKKFLTELNKQIK